MLEFSVLVVNMFGHQMNVNWDKPLKEPIFEDCHRCNDFIITTDKAELSLFMLDHYGKDGIRICAIPDDINN